MISYLIIRFTWNDCSGKIILFLTIWQCNSNIKNTYSKLYPKIIWSNVVRNKNHFRFFHISYYCCLDLSYSNIIIWILDAANIFYCKYKYSTFSIFTCDSKYNIICFHKRLFCIFPMKEITSLSFLCVFLIIIPIKTL